MDRILLQLDNKANRRVLTNWISQGYQIELADNGLSSHRAFDLAIFDGPTLARHLSELAARREAERPVFLPFLLVTSRQSLNVVVRQLRRAVDEIILMPIEKFELQIRIENLLRVRRFSLELKEQHEAVDRLSVTDDVSGFHNTRFLHRFLDQFFSSSRVKSESLSLVFFDMDGFKNVVDTYGHPLGAKVLREVAEVVNLHIESYDKIVRYGGDEYIVILPGQGKDEALAKVRRIKNGIAGTPFLKEEGINVRVTASFGLAAYPNDANDKKALLAEADRCLFQSKGRGKNRISVKGRELDPNAG